VSGIYFTVNQDAPGGLDETARQVQDGLQTAVSAVHTTQLETDRFLTEHGSAVLPGHAPVNAPGRQGDPDLGGPDASDD
jgi:hypothetical protein